jgi:hypothetical protein
MKKLTLTILTCLFILSPNVLLDETVKWTRFGRDLESVYEEF